MTGLFGGCVGVMATVFAAALAWGRWWEIGIAIVMLMLTTLGLCKHIKVVTR